MKAFLKFGVRDALGRADEAGAELHADRAHFQIAGDQPAMADPAGDEDRHVVAKRRQYLLREHRGRDRPDMAARLHPLDHQRIDAGADQLLRQRQRRGEADQLGAVRLDPVDRPGGRQAAGEHDMAHLMLRADVDQVAQHRVHGDQVHAERLRRQRLRRRDLRVEQVRRHRPAGDHPEGARIGQSGDEVALRNPAHRAAKHGIVAAEELGAALHQALRRLRPDAGWWDRLAHCFVTNIFFVSPPLPSPSLWPRRPKSCGFMLPLGRMRDPRL